MNVSNLLKEELFNPLIEYPHEQRKANVPHAPARLLPLNRDEKILAIKNALRYVPKEHQPLLAKEFAEELKEHGHIYAFRFMPNYHLKVKTNLFSN